MADPLCHLKDDVATAIHGAQANLEHALAHLAHGRAPGRPHYLTGARRGAWVERRGSGQALPRRHTAQPTTGEPPSGWGLLVTKQLVEQLSGVDRIALFPWPPSTLIDYQVMVDVTEFYVQTEGQGSLVAVWSILKREGKEAIVSRKSCIRAPAGTEDYGAYVRSK